MSLWNTGSITNVNTGTSANDGSGDDIRNAFIEVNQNIQLLSQWLAAPVQFQSANIDNTMMSLWANVTNANIITLFGGNTQGGQANINIATHLVPTGTGQFDLGSPTNRFRTVYSQSTNAATQIQSSSDAGLLKVHANAAPGDIQDTGILGNISSDYNSSTNVTAYAFFGHQYTTNDFAYKIIGYDPTALGGNNIVEGGTYGNVHFGSAFLSNTTPGGNTLIVAGDTSITGNLTASGNLNIGGTGFAEGGYQIITTNIIGNYGTPYTGGVIAGNTVFLSGAISTSANTGAVSLPYGGLGVYGNVYTQTGMVAPSFYGQMRTADQPYITSLGTLPTLNAISGSFTSLSSTGLTTTGIVNLAGPTLTVASNTSIASFANIASGLIVGANAWIAGNLTASFANIASGLIVGANAWIASNLTAGAVFAPTIYSNGYRYANGSAFISTSVANTAEITGNISSGYNVGLSLTATGVTAGNYGSATSIPTIVVDSKGRITSLTANAVSTTINLAGGTGTGNVQNGGTLTVSGSTGLTTSVAGSTISLTNTGVTSATGSYGLTVSGSTGAVTFTNSGVTSLIAGTDISVSSSTGNITVNATSTLNTVLSRGATTTTTMTVGTILPSANLTYNIGSTSAWFNTFYGVSSQAKYADLAERYTSDADYEAGTVVVFGGPAEITTTTQFGDVSVAGAISTDPAYLMNAMAEGLPVALRGRVPVKVIGPVVKGDLLVTAGQNPGYATSVGKSRDYPLAVFAKALETNTAEGTKIIEAVII
jgi:hypothetical protein